MGLRDGSEMAGRCILGRTLRAGIGGNYLALRPDLVPHDRLQRGLDDGHSLHDVLAVFDLLPDQQHRRNVEALPDRVIGWTTRDPLALRWSIFFFNYSAATEKWVGLRRSRRQ